MRKRRSTPLFTNLSLPFDKGKRVQEMELIEVSPKFFSPTAPTI